MKNSILFIALIMTLKSFSQNVGIGNPIPAEKLDVNGNVNLTGTIKVNGTDGNPNQVLMKNSSGTFGWGDITEYKNINLLTASSGSWLVPAGVTKIMVELWGAGGGGNCFAGGGAGGYIRGILFVTPGSSCSYGVGAGGNFASNSNAGDGNPTSFTPVLTVLTLTANGGNGADYPGGSFSTAGAGGTFNIAGSGIGSYQNYTGAYGGAGRPHKKSYMQQAATTFYEIGEGGMGGDAPYTFNNGGVPGNHVYNSTSSTLVHRVTGHTNGGFPGGGGGSGQFYGAVFTNGGLGSAGAILIHY